MKNAKRLLAFVLTSLMVLFCLAGMLPVVASESVGARASYPTTTIGVSCDAIFLGTGKSVDATDELPIEDADPSYSIALAGETKLGDASYVTDNGGLIKVMGKRTYLRFWGWTSQKSKVVAFGYELGGERVFNENFTIADEDLAALLAGWGHPNAVRACITVPLTGLKKGKIYSVQLLVKHEDGTIGTLSEGFPNFMVEVEHEHEHETEIIPAVPPTPTETGLTGGARCSICGEILVAQKVIDKISVTDDTTNAPEADDTDESKEGDTDVPEADDTGKADTSSSETATTEDQKDAGLGCNGAIGTGTTVIILTAAAAVALKRKDD